MLIIPMSLLHLVCYSQNCFAQKFEKNGNIVTYRGNKFEMSGQRIDTTIEVDKKSGDELMKIVMRDPIPLKMNDARIFNSNEVMLKPAPENTTLEDHLFRGLASEFNKLPDDSYHLYIGNIVVDNTGKIVYYEYTGFTAHNSKTKIPPAVKKAIDQKIDPLMSKAPVFKPGKVNGYKVIVRTDLYIGDNRIDVKNHKYTTSK